MESKTVETAGSSLAVTKVHTLIIGSGAAGLNAAAQLWDRGVRDILIVTEGLEKGTSINTGSDKQTYYKLALCGTDTDAPGVMAENYFSGGSMHGDLALVEASLSARAFLNLVGIGVPFPQDAFGQFIGYKTDHDPRQRATSIGPYTSREMCRALIRRIKEQGVPVREGVDVVSLLTVEQDGSPRAAGAIALDEDDRMVVFEAENVVLAVGGPGGLYKTSVYPDVHTGAIGLGLMIGARAQSLPESQYGMASIKFRWNVSGTYMQVVPRFISTEADGVSDAGEFLPEYFESTGDMNSMVFLKGYQWPFDSRKIAGGSSIIDILVYIETVLKGRRVFLDFRSNPDGFDFGALSEESRTYLEKSQALLDTPIARLEKMNPGAIQLYLDHGIDIREKPLEIAVCAQHNNGGLAADHWWQSLNIKRLFPVGEVNGSHGAYRPGGSALNSGQVGSIRAADYIAARCVEPELVAADAGAAAREGEKHLGEWIVTCNTATRSWQEEREELQLRMSRAGAHIRDEAELEKAVKEARAACERLEKEGNKATAGCDLREALRNRHLCLAHLVYLEAVLFAVRSGVGSRGSAMVRDPQGTQAHDRLGDEWNFAPEDVSFRESVLETQLEPDGSVVSEWVPRRPVPESDLWFETAWATYREGRIYD